MKKTISMILLIAMLAGCVACGDSGTANETTTAEPNETTTTEAETEKTYDLELPDVDYEGADFTFFMRNSDYFISDQYVEELNGEILNDAIYNRNLAVQNLLNVKFMS